MRVKNIAKPWPSWSQQGDDFYSLWFSSCMCAWSACLASTNSCPVRVKCLPGINKQHVIADLAKPSILLLITVPRIMLAMLPFLTAAYHLFPVLETASGISMAAIWRMNAVVHISDKVWFLKWQGVIGEAVAPVLLSFLEDGPLFDLGIFGALGGVSCNRAMRAYAHLTRTEPLPWRHRLSRTLAQ